MRPEWIVPDWKAPARVRAFVTTRHGGVSRGEYASLNLGASGGDDPAHVERNRLIVCESLPAMPRWLAQVHGTTVADLDRAASGAGVYATRSRSLLGQPRRSPPPSSNEKSAAAGFQAFRWR